MKKILLKLLSLLPYLIVFLFSLYVPSDPDLGWHLKYGEYFFQHGQVLRDNTFSTMMPGFQWANTSWLTDVLTYGVYHLGGFVGLSILGALLVTLTFFFFSKVARLTLWDQAFLFTLLLYLEQPVDAVSFRGQQLTLLLVGVMYFLIGFYKTKPKIFLLLIPLFVLWANLNGEFLLGLALLAVWIGVSIGQKMFADRHEPNRKMGTYGREILYLISVYGACLIATVINPFGIGIHTAALSHVGSPLLKDISEYTPFAMFSQVWWNQVVIGVLLILGFISLFFKGKVSEKMPLLVASMLLFLLSFAVRRYAWPAYYVIIPLLTPLSRYLQPDGKKATLIGAAIFLTILLGIGLRGQVPLTKYTQYTWNSYCDSPNVLCSNDAAVYIERHHLTRHLLTLYGWGGWLIWNYPAVKPAIDGRMHLWNKNGYSAFADYYDYEQNFKDIDVSSYDVVLMPPDKPIYSRLQFLARQGKWELVYHDPAAGVFVRKE